MNSSTNVDNPVNQIAALLTEQDAKPEEEDWTHQLMKIRKPTKVNRKMNRLQPKKSPPKARTKA